MRPTSIVFLVVLENVVGWRSPDAFILTKSLLRSHAITRFSSSAPKIASSAPFHPPFQARLRASGRRRDSCIVRAALSAASNSRTSLQEELWELLDVLPAMQETQLKLCVTQSTAICNLGFVATRDIALGEILVSIPWRFAVSVEGSAILQFAPNTVGQNADPCLVQLTIGGELLRTSGSHSDCWRHSAFFQKITSTATAAKRGSCTQRRFCPRA